MTSSKKIHFFSHGYLRWQRYLKLIVEIACINTAILLWNSMLCDVVVNLQAKSPFFRLRRLHINPFLILRFTTYSRFFSFFDENQKELACKLRYRNRYVNTVTSYNTQKTIV